MVARVDHLAEIKKIAELWKNVDPKVYEKFLRHLDAHTFEVTVAVTEAPSAEILQAQGRAQHARKLMAVFSEVLDTRNAAP